MRQIILLPNRSLYFEDLALSRSRATFVAFYRESAGLHSLLQGHRNFTYKTCLDAVKLWCLMQQLSV